MRSLLSNPFGIISWSRYAVTGTTGNATLKTEGQLQYYENDQLLGERYRLDIWPLFALGDGGDVRFSPPLSLPPSFPPSFPPSLPPSLSLSLFLSLSRARAGTSLCQCWCHLVVN